MPQEGELLGVYDNLKGSLEGDFNKLAACASLSRKMGGIFWQVIGTRQVLREACRF